MKRFTLYKKPFSLLFILCTACTNNSELLQSNEYPLQIASATVSSSETASRVAENADGTSSQWTDGDRISVRIGDDGKTGTYTLNADGSVKTADNPVYWQSRAAQTITAWYPATDGAIDLSDQTAGLKYVLKATAEDKSFSDAVSLDFKHQLAKVRVKLSGDKADDVTAVAVKGYTSFSTEQGKVGTATNEGYIKMMKTTYSNDEYYEANLTPQTINADDFVQITADSKTFICKMECNTTMLAAGNAYTFTVTVETENATYANPDTHTIYTFDTGEITADLVSEAMNETGILKIVGEISQEDLQIILDNCRDNVVQLDLSEALCDNIKIPQEAFYTTWSKPTCLETILLPEGITKIGDYAFKDCTTLISANIPQSVNHIGQGTFQKSSITSAVIPNGITSILKDTFSQCSSLTSIYLPASTTDIGFFAFNGCKNLMQIICEASNPPTCNSISGYGGIDKAKCVVYVPMGCVNAYKAASTWKEFENIEEITE